MMINFNLSQVICALRNYKPFDFTIKHQEQSIQCKKILSVVIIHRIICILVIGLSSFLDPVYDLSQATNFGRQLLRSTDTPKLLPRQNDILSSFSAWDSHHYLSLARLGYVYEHQFAFHPLFPLASRFLAEGVSRLMNLSYPSLQLILFSGVLISNLSVFLSSVALLRLAKKLTGSSSVSSKAAILFALQPASSFFSVMYPESLFSLFSFLGMSYLIESSFLKASIMFMLSGATKPNSLIYVGFFIWYLLLNNVNTQNYSVKSKLVSRIAYFFLLSVITLLPFIAMQVWAYFIFCKPSLEERKLPEWCYERIPLLFFHVQKTFWNNGIMRSWSLSNVSNIAVSAPMLIISIAALVEYLVSDVYNIIGLWIFAKPLKKLTLPFKKFGVPGYRGHLNAPVSCMHPSPLNYPFMVHWAAVTFIVVFYMQIQTGIRALVAVPMLHIYVASLHTNGKNSILKSNAFKFILNYYIIYSIVAAIPLAYGYPPI